MSVFHWPLNYPQTKWIPHLTLFLSPFLEPHTTPSTLSTRLLRIPLTPLTISHHIISLIYSTDINHFPLRTYIHRLHRTQLGFAYLPIKLCCRTTATQFLLLPIAPVIIGLSFHSLFLLIILNQTTKTSIQEVITSDRGGYYITLGHLSRPQHSTIY